MMRMDQRIKQLENQNQMKLMLYFKLFVKVKMLLLLNALLFTTYKYQTLTTVICWQHKHIIQ